MKKFFSILCALAIVLSASAAPLQQFSKSGLVQKTPKMLLKNGGNQAAVKAVNFAKPAKSEVVKLAEPVVSAKAAKAKKATNNVTINKALSQDYGGGNIYYALYSEDGTYRFDFDFYLSDATATDLTPGTTYTQADMADMEYSFITNLTTGAYIDYATVSFVKTVSAEKTLIDVNITDANGDQWVLSYDSSKQPQAPAGGTYVADAATAKYFSSSSDIQYILTFTEAKLVFAFDILLPEGEQDVKSDSTYTLDGMDTQYTYGVFDQSAKINLTSVSFVKKVAADASYTLTIVAQDDKGNTWNLSYAQAAPTIRNIDLTLTGFAEPGSSMSQIEAANADSTQLVSLIILKSELAGNFTEEDLFTSWSLSYVLYEGVEYDIEKAALSITYDEPTHTYTVTGTLNCINPDDATDIVIFNLNLAAVGPEPVVPTDEKEITLTDGVLTSLDGAWQLIAFNADSTQMISIAAYADSIPGAYKGSALAANYCYVGYFTASDTVWYDMADADLLVAVEGTNATVTGTMTGVNADDETDAVLFKLNIKATIEEYVAPTGLQYDTENGAFEATFDGYTLDTDYVQYGVVYVDATNAQNQAIALEIWATELTAGTYEINSTQEAGTVSASTGLNSQGYLTYSLAGDVNAAGQYTKIWFMVSGTVEIAADGTITVDALNSYDQPIKATISKAQAIDNVATKAAATKRVVNGTLVIEKNGVLYNAQGAVVK
ncbi:MAG: hypothetical protein IJ204_08220 [Paludibacteraceae bacterium]|nr:hypothetical protein [Paludibacteraceae bacterium]